LNKPPYPVSSHLKDLPVKMKNETGNRLTAALKFFYEKPYYWSPVKFFLNLL